MRCVLFACIQNAGRSQMAAALFARAADPIKARAISAGSRPAAQVHPVVVEAMRELGVDLSRVRPRALSEAIAEHPTLIVTMGCGEECPFVPGAERLDWAIEDPSSLPLSEVRRIRDGLAARIEALVRERGWAR